MGPFNETYIHGDYIYDNSGWFFFLFFSIVAKSMWLLPPYAFSDLEAGTRHYKHHIGSRVSSEM